MNRHRNTWIVLTILALLVLPISAYLAQLQPQSAVADPAVAVAKDVEFSFVQVSDLHFGSTDSVERAQAVADLINQLPMDLACVVITGDVLSDKITDETLRTQAANFVSQFKVPVHIIPGNHDLARQGDAIATTTDLWTQTFGPLASKAEHHGVVFLSLYTEPLAKNFEQPGYDPLAWLETELQAAGDKPVIVIHHTPSVPDFYHNAEHPGWKPETYERWNALLNSANVKAVLAGHFHRAEQHWLGEVPLYVATPVIGFWGRQACYRIYTYRNGKLSFRTQYVEK